MNTASMAPVVLLGFNRPELTKQVFEVIRGIKPEKLFLVMDGPRAGFSEDVRLVSETREVVADIDWPCEVVREYAPENLGLKRRITSGLDLVFDLCDRAIIVEDDCVADPSFSCCCNTVEGSTGSPSHYTGGNTESFAGAGGVSWSRV